MKRPTFFVLTAALALSACGFLDAPVNNTGGTVSGLSDTVVVKATVGLGLGEIAFTGAEQLATGAINSKRLPLATVEQINVDVAKARGLRQKARDLVAQGEDASAVLKDLTTAVSTIQLLAAPAQEKSQ